MKLVSLISKISLIFMIYSHSGGSSEINNGSSKLGTLISEIIALYKPLDICLEEKTSIVQRCDALQKPNAKRLIFCRPENNFYLRNVMFEKNTFIYDSRQYFRSDVQIMTSGLPNLQSVIQHRKHNLPISIRGVDQRLKCQKYYNGTLHVTGLFTMHNAFHAINDNIFALLGQIITDSFLHPSSATRPRALVTTLPIHSFRGVPHMRLMTEYVDDHLELGNIDGWCFNRVVYGSGPRSKHSTNTVLTLSLDI